MAGASDTILIAEPYLTLGLLMAAGALGGWLRHAFDEVAHRRARPRRLAFVLLGMTTGCLAFTLARPLFPIETTTAHYYISLIGVGSVTGFLGAGTLCPFASKAFDRVTRQRQAVGQDETGYSG